MTISRSPSPSIGRNTTNLEAERLSQPLSDVKTKDMTPQQIAHGMRHDLIKLLQSNILISSCQLTQRKQLGRILHKYFNGYKSNVSVKLLIESIELHYEGLDNRSKSVL